MSAVDSTASEPSAAAAGRIAAWIDAVFAEAGVAGEAPLKRELANRFASLVTLGPLSVYALDHDAKGFCRWLVEEDQDRALERLDEALRTVAEQSAAIDGAAVETHLAALTLVLDGVFEIQRPSWVDGVKADYGR